MNSILKLTQSIIGRGEDKEEIPLLYDKDGKIVTSLEPPFDAKVIK